MQRKGRKVNINLYSKLHSIPKLKKNVKSNVVYSIPCIFALVLLFGLMNFINPDMSGGYAYAEVEDQSVPFTNTTSSLILDSDDVKTSASLGGVSYVNKDITIKAVNITDYVLMIKSSVGLSEGNDELTEFTGAAGNSPENMQDNSWGYSYGEALEQDNKTYNSFTGLNQILEKGTASSNNSISTTTKPLTFAAKFGEDTTPGVYRAEVTISLITTPAKLAFDGITTMQEMTVDICKRADKFDSAFLEDTRDGNYYTVTKLDDNRCWMTDNLMITDKTITPEDSDVSANFSIPASSIGGFTADDVDKAKVYVPTAADLEGSDVAVGSVSYYNWYAATAGTGDANMTSGQASGSICPKGWKLPTSRYNGQFRSLLSAANILSNATGSSKIQSSPYNFKFTGYISNSAVGSTNSGSWWSSSPTTYLDRVYRMVNSASIVNGDNGNLAGYYGMAVRCLVYESDLDLTKITTMQEMSPDVCTNSSLYATKELEDIRDGNKYTVTKLEDNNCWMTDNLRLKLTKGQTLTGNTSDVDGFTPTESTIFGSDNLAGSFTDTFYYKPQSYAESSDADVYYYSWAAATAGTTGVNLENNDTSNIQASGSASGSICPVGWHLIAGGQSTDSNDFGALVAALGGSSVVNKETLQQSPYNFMPVGYVRYSILRDATSTIMLWTKRVSSETDGIAAGYSSSQFAQGFSIVKFTGLPIRCVANY